jgi:hypothetical protein
MKRRIGRPAKTERHRVTFIQLSSCESSDGRTENEAYPRGGREEIGRRDESEQERAKQMSVNNCAASAFDIFLRERVPLFR